MDRKVLLMILDGWGIGDGSVSDVIAKMAPKYITGLQAAWPHAQLRTDGENVGLPQGQMGNSEVGHLNIGAGRVVYQDLVKINRACRAADDSPEALRNNKEVRALIDHVKTTGCRLHLMGLFSDGGVHASLAHLERFLELAKAEGLDKTYVHAFMDGRDTDPKSGLGFVKSVDINRGDYIGLQVTPEHMEYFIVTNDGRVNYDNKHTMMGITPYYRNVECTVVSDITETKNL